MKLSSKDIADYKRIYKARYSAEIDDETARRELSALVRQLELIYRPITAEQFKRQEADDKQKPGGQSIV